MLAGNHKIPPLMHERNLMDYVPRLHPADVANQQQFSDLAIQSDKSKFEMEQALSELTATYKRIITENIG